MCRFIKSEVVVVLSVSMSKFGRRIKTAPEGYDYIEPTITAIENELRESKLVMTNVLLCIL